MAILDATREIRADGAVSSKPFDHNTSANDGAGFHHMHRLDLLMCLYQQVFAFGPETNATCPIQVHLGKRLQTLEQSADRVTAGFADGTRVEGDVLVGADGINSKVLELQWPETPPRRWTEVTVYRGLIPRDKVAKLAKSSGRPLDHNPIDWFSMDVRKLPEAWALTYWVRGGELLNVWLAYYEPDSAEFEEDWGDWFPIDHAEMTEKKSRAFDGDPRLEDILALAGAMENPTKWGLRP